MPRSAATGLIDVAQVRQGQREVREHRSVGVVVSRTDDAMRRITKAITLLQQGAGGNELPEEAAGQTAAKYRQATATTMAAPPPPCIAMLPAPIPMPTRYMPRAAMETAATK